MRYAKLINGSISYAPNPIAHDGMIRYNPPGSVYEAEGYKPVRYTDPPTPEPGYIAVPEWAETAEEIVQTWTEELEPVKINKETVEWHQDSEAVRSYLAEVDYSGVPYTETEISDFLPPSPMPITNTKPAGVTVDGVTFYNEAPNALTPFATTNKAGTLTPLDQVRWIKSQTTNCRDLGGWACDGGTVRYGLLYRSGELVAADEDLFIHDLKIHTECDLTADGVPAFPGKMRYIGHTSYAMYSLSNTEAWRVNLRGIFDAVKFGDPVIFHCAMGADRTGTLACILEALLGVSQSDLDKDYELTSFYSLRARNGNYQGGTGDWAHLMSALTALSGSTIRDKAVTFVLSLGFTAAEINAYRRAMIDGTPADITGPTYTITNTLSNCASSNASASIGINESYAATITANSGYTLDGATVSVTMGGTDITSTAYNGGAISIPSVTGNVVITVAAAEKVKVNLFDKNDPDVVLRGRINSSGNAVAYADGQLVTGFIPAQVGDVFTIETDHGQTTATGGNGYTGVLGCYTSGKAFISPTIGAAAAEAWDWNSAVTGGACTFKSTVSSKDYSGTGYVRFALAYTDIESIKIYKE